jgi:cytochrome c oxidase cbb3-type subunit I/II
MCAINLWKTIRGKEPVDGTVETPILARAGKDRMTWVQTFINDPIAHIFVGLAFGILWFFLPPYANVAALLVCILLTLKGVHAFMKSGGTWATWHESLIENYLPFTVLVFISVAIGGAVQIIPSLIVNRDENIEGRLQELYTPLELAGRDVYVDEGCYNCHSQMIRMLVPDVMRYGRPGVPDDYSHMGESLYDHPFQWGSKRTGPDLAREGGPIVEGKTYMRDGSSLKGKSNVWHHDHFLNPRGPSPGSNMPPYPWLFEEKTDFKSLPAKISTQTKLGVPWPAMKPEEIKQRALDHAIEIADSIVRAKANLDGTATLTDEQAKAVNDMAETKVVALIAYMQKLGAYKEIEKDKPRQPTPLDPDSYRDLTGAGSLPAPKEQTAR